MSAGALDRAKRVIVDELSTHVASPVEKRRASLAETADDAARFAAPGPMKARRTRAPRVTEAPRPRPIEELPPDHAALRALRGNDDASAEVAFTHIFRFYYLPLVHAALRAYVDERADAEEIVQNLYTRLWRDRDKLPDGVTVEACLYTRLRSDALNFLATRRRHLSLSSDETLQAFADQHNVLDAIVRRSLVVEVWGAVRELPARCREAFRLKYHEHCSDREIATRMGVSVGTVEQHLVMSRRKVREYFGTKVM